MVRTRGGTKAGVARRGAARRARVDKGECATNGLTLANARKAVNIVAESEVAVGDDEQG